MERILHCVGGSLEQNSGIASYIINIYKNIDKKKYQFDFIVFGDNIGNYEKDVKKSGAKVFHVPSFGDSPIKNMKQTMKIMKKGKYNIMHRHTSVSLSWPDFLCARLCGIKNRIAHSHGTKTDQLKQHKMFYKLFIMNVNRYAACGVMAGKWLFPQKKHVTVLNNGIDTAKFEFDEQSRNEIRNKLNISKDEFVVMHIGRFSDEKNHGFLVDVFKKLKQKNPNSMLILVGNGAHEMMIKEKVKELGMENYVYFAGLQSDITPWLCAADVFVLPSKFEGFPVSVVEAETSGLPVVMSTNVPEEADINKKAVRVSLDRDEDEWAKIILNAYNTHKNDNRKQGCQGTIAAGFDIKESAKQVERYYEKLLRSS